jgi:hypothetical protein
MEKLTSDERNHIQLIKTWINNFIINYNICPFAASVFKDDKILYLSENSTDQEKLLTAFWECTNTLIESGNYATAFLILPNATEDFEDFLDFYYKAEWLLEDTGIDKLIQLVAFHPRFQYASSQADDKHNFTNRSPFPMIHLLPVKSVSQAIEAFGDTQSITEANNKLLENMPMEKLKSCIKQP